jgi:hypothetical protein
MNRIPGLAECNGEPKEKKMDEFPIGNVEGRI